MELEKIPEAKEEIDDSETKKEKSPLETEKEQRPSMGRNREISKLSQMTKDELKSKRKKVRWLTRAMAEDFTRHDVLLTTFKEAILYLIFVAAVTACTIGRRSSSMFYLTQGIKGQFLDKEFPSANDVEMNFHQIKSVSDFFHYTETLLLDSLFWEYDYNPYDLGSVIEKDRKILFENKLLGVPRLRQVIYFSPMIPKVPLKVKVKKDSCAIDSSFKKIQLHCYDAYSPSIADKESFGLKTKTAWVYSSQEETKSEPYSGNYSTYDGGGFYQDLSAHRNRSIEIIKELKENLWIARGTRAIFVDFSIYNANLNLFCICKLIFELPPTGGILPSHSFQTVQLIQYVSKIDYVTFACEILVYIIAGYFLFEEIRELIYFKLRYFRQFWTYIDVTIIAMSAANLVTSILLLPNVEEALEKIKANPNKYGNLEYLGYVKLLYNNFAASLLFFSYIKLFKYLNFNKTMGQLNNTLKRCAVDLVGFSIMFFIIFFAFAELGCLLFGNQVLDFSGFGIAMFTLLRTILGDFDYMAIERANRILAPIYFLSYIFFVFFVLLNMFLAIINDTYADVKTEIAIVPDEMQMYEYLKRGLFKLLAKCGCNIRFFQEEKVEINATIEEIRNALKKCGFSDLEIEMFFARYNIDPLAEVGDYDVKKIMKALEGQAIITDTSDEDDANLVHLNDFTAQQEKLNYIERNIHTLGAKMDALINKLESLENARKTKPPLVK